MVGGKREIIAYAQMAKLTAFAVAKAPPSGVGGTRVARRSREIPLALSHFHLVHTMRRVHGNGGRGTKLGREDIHTSTSPTRNRSFFTGR